jgi:hypothetical protein
LKRVVDLCQLIPRKLILAVIWNQAIPTGAPLTFRSAIKRMPHRPVATDRLR